VVPIWEANGKDRIKAYKMVFFEYPLLHFENHKLLIYLILRLL